MSNEYVRMRKSTMDSIAKAIQEKEGSTDQIPGAEMPARILALGGGVNFDTVVEVEENSFTNSLEVHEYFGSKIQTKGFVALLLGTVDGTNNQCIAMLAGAETTNERDACIRIRNGQWQSRAINVDYDAAIVPGTRYGVIIPK